MCTACACIKMNSLGNVLDKGKEALHIGHTHGHGESKPVTPSKHGHARSNTASSVMSHLTLAKHHNVHRSDTVKTNSTDKTPPRPYLTRVPTVQTK